MSTVYCHPDGYKINIARGVMTMTNDADESVSVPIGDIGLRELGERLIDLSDSEYTAGDFAEQAGSAIASNCVRTLINSASQGESMVALRTALLDLQRLPHPKRAAGGFAVAMVNVLEIGLKNLPKGGV